MSVDSLTLAMLLAAGVLVAIAAAAMRRVPESHVYTVERFGRFVRLLRPGLRWLWPLAERIGCRQDLRERQLRLPHMALLTQDRIALDADAVCFFQVTDPAKASYEVHDLEQALTTLLASALRRRVGQQDLEALLAGRTRVGGELMAACAGSVASWGVQLNRVELDAIELPAALVEAVALERTTELERRSAVLAAEGERRTARLKAEAERDTQIMAAETRTRVATLEAEARERSTQAEARASLMLSRAVAEGSPLALNYLIAQQYVAALKSLAESDNGRFVVLPLESGGLSMSLDGIRALAESAFGPPDEPTAGAREGDDDGEPRRAGTATERRAEGPGSVRPFQPPDVEQRIG